MQRTARPEGLDLPSPQLQRNHSSPNDRTPSISGSSLLSPPSVSPDPAYIAASAASQIVNSDRADRGQDSSGYIDSRIELDTAVVSPGSLVLVNSFLDQLLFSFLASARSTSIAALRPAILEVLKPRLGKEAIDGADEELQGYLAGGDVEELLAFHSGHEFKGEYNLNLVWRRTRLRCMVYTRLGDMEEEDEDSYLEQEQQADAHDGQPRLTRDLGSVSPAAAIFLTSILEFIGEQALLVAGEASYTRMQMKGPSAKNQRAIVEEVDMEKLAFNTTLGRLWRSWKKRVRSSSFLSTRPVSRDVQRYASNSLSTGGSASRNTSVSEENVLGYFDTSRRKSVAGVLREDESVSEAQGGAKDLPEEPDFSNFSTGAPSPEAKKSNRGRPRSMNDYRKPLDDFRARTPTRSENQDNSGTNGNQERPMQRRQRSSSLPARQTPYVSPVEETFATPTEGPDPLLHDDERLDAEEEMPKLTDDSRTATDFADGTQAVSTMYDGAISHATDSLPETMDGRNNRGISTYMESSNNTDEYERGMQPQALRLHKSFEDVQGQPRDPRLSTLSSNYSFQSGELNPLSSTGEAGQVTTGRGNDIDSGALLKHADSVNQPAVDSDRQYIGNLSNLATLQGHPLRSYDESKKAVKRETPVLHEALTDTEGDVYQAETAIRPGTGALDEGEVIKIATSNHQVAAPSQGVPPLSPLRELLDAAPDTSDEASSMALSQDASKPDPFVPTHRYRSSGNGSISSSMFNQAPPPASAIKTVNYGADKAAVQRVSPSTSTPRSANGRTSTSSNRDGRPMTAGSSTSQVSSKIKGMIGRDSGDLARQPMPQRDSFEGSGSLIKSPTKEQDFEELIKSGETVKYTLTPQNMREMETPDSSRYQNRLRTETAELADFLRSSAPTSTEPERPANSKSLSKLKGLNGLRSNPTNGVSPTTSSYSPASPISPISPVSPLETAKQPPRSVPKSPAPRSPGAVARGPTAKDDSLRDFADFIRSTGPPSGPPSLPNPVASNPTRVSRPGSSSSPSLGTGKPFPKKITKQNPVLVSKKSDAQLPKRTTSKLQAREPTVGNNNSTAELADFLRAGPMDDQINGRSSAQRSGAGGQRAVNGLTNGKTREAVNSSNSIASTQDSVAPSKMTQSSTNSRTGLLDSSNRAAPTSAPSNRNTTQRTARNDDPPGPGRKQRRVKDPYAIESDSENEDGFGTPQAAPEREEESLSDFLRNYNPSPTATNARGPPPTISGAPKIAKQSSPTFRERIARNIAVVPDYRPLPPKTPKKSSTSKSPPQSNESRTTTSSSRSAETSARRQQSHMGYSPPNQNNVVRGRTTSNSTAPQLPPLDTARLTSPHLLSSQNGPIKPDPSSSSNRPPPTTTTNTANPTNRSGPPRKHQLQAREEHGVRGGALSLQGSGMSDLADFLRETEPPAPSGPVGLGVGAGGGAGRPLSPPVKEKERGAFGRMFGRK